MAPNPILYSDTPRNSSEIYGASKAAVNHLTRYFACRYGKSNIPINSIAPGGVLNEQHQGPNFIHAYESLVPQSTLCSSNDVSNLVYYLSFESPTYLTGQTIFLDRHDFMVKLSSKYAPLCFIAEIGLNHLGSFDLAKRHIDLAKESGASIAKFQTYKASNRASPGSPIHEVLRNCELSFDQFERIKSYCDSVQIEFSSTPFCLESSDFLSSLELDVVKVASFHLENKVLLRHLFENTSFTILSLPVCLKY